MTKPPAVPGMCPYYDPRSQRCYLSGSSPSGGTVSEKCTSRSNYTRCGNFEAKMNGTNYRNK